MTRTTGAEAKGKMDLPFASILSGPALVTAVLYVAGFSYEWSLYYNFGLEHIARQLPTLSTAIAAFEVVRVPSDALYAAALLIVPQILLAAVSFLAETFSSSKSLPVHYVASTVVRTLNAGNGLVRIALAAFLLVYAAAYAGTLAGSHAYRALAIESNNALPRVTVIFSGEEVPVICEQRSGLAMPSADAKKPDALIGSPYALAELRGGRACNLPGQSSWRLLYRDDKFAYLFQTVRSADAGRPLTLVVPLSEKIMLILNGAEANG